MILDQESAHALTLRSLASNGRHGISVRLWARGKSETELGALIGAGTFCCDGSLVRFYQRFADRQAEAKSTRPRSGALFEGIEDFWQRLRLNAKPGIRDLNMQLFVRIIAGRDMNLSVFGGKLHRVVDEVPKDLLQSSRIGTEMHLLRGQIMVIAPAANTSRLRRDPESVAHGRRFAVER